MQARHFLQLVLLSAVWGASFPLIRVAVPAFGPFAMACLRCALAAVVLAVLMHLTRQGWPAWRHWRGMTVTGAATVAAPFVLFNAAGLVLPAGYSAVCNATAPLFGVLGGALFERERLTGRKLAGCACGLGGVALLVQLGPVQPDWRVMLAIAACVTAAACYGFGAIQMKRVAHQHHPLPASAVVHVTAALLLAPPAAIALPDMQWRTEAVLALLVLGGITSGLMYWISMRLMREIPASAATSSAFLIPMFGVTWGGLFLGEPVTAGMLPGVALVLAACALVTGFNPFDAFRRR
jgi:drug/metabolite transporter (DMT)-like permease